MRNIFLGKCACGFKTEELSTRAEAHRRLKAHACDQAPLVVEETTFYYCQHCQAPIKPLMSDLGTIITWVNAVDGDFGRRTCFHRVGMRRTIFEMVKKECSSSQPIPGP